MMGSRIAVLGAACLVAAACSGGAQTDKPVATSTGRGTTTSPSGDATDARGTSQVRLVSALPASQRIDLASDDSVLFSSVPYKTVTPYKELKDNAAKFSIRSPGASNASLADNNEAMADGHRYTLVALPGDEGKGAQLKAFRDEVVPEAGKAKVRVINATPTGGEVDVAMSGKKDALFEDIDFGHEAGFKEVDPQSGTLQIRLDGGDYQKSPKVIDAGRMQFEAGRAYTLVVAGTNPARPDIIKFVDEPVGGSAPGGANAANTTDDGAKPATRQTSANDRTGGTATKPQDEGGMTKKGAETPSRQDSRAPSNQPS